MRAPTQSPSLLRLGPETRDLQVGRLNRPWIGQEGPLEVQFFQAEEGAPELLPRGLAFDGEATVHWDEAGVRVVHPTLGEEKGVHTLEHDVIIRERLFDGKAKLSRKDYLREGLLLGSHYHWSAGKPETKSQEAGHA